MHKGPNYEAFVIEKNVDSMEARREPQFREVNEIKQYLDGRYILSIEAVWHIFEFETTHYYPYVEMLQFHLPEQHNIVCNHDEDLDDVAGRAEHNISMLMAWFTVNQVDHEANGYTYC